MARRGRTVRTHSFTDAARGERLQKVMAEAGIASRRRCEELIEQGEVTVNGEVVDALPAWVDPARDRIVAAGKVVGRQERSAAGRAAGGPPGGGSGPPRKLYIMLYKPRGVVSTNSDPEGRPRAIDLVKHPSKTRLYPVGRLDIDSSGLMLLTNDGDLANRLTHPRYEVHKTYEVTVRGQLGPEDVARLEEGIWLYDKRSGSGSKTRGVRLKLLKRDRERTKMLMELREGRNRQIRRMMLQLGHPVKRLRRITLGPLKLKGLATGQWRELTSKEVASLRKASTATEPARTAKSTRPRSTTSKRAASAKAARR